MRTQMISRPRVRLLTNRTSMMAKLNPYVIYYGLPSWQTIDSIFRWVKMCFLILKHHDCNLSSHLLMTKHPYFGPKNTVSVYVCSSLANTSSQYFRKKRRRQQQQQKPKKHSNKLHMTSLKHRSLSFWNILSFFKCFFLHMRMNHISFTEFKI